MNTQGWTAIMLGSVIAVQVLDAGLHIAIREVDLLRIMANAVLVTAVSLGVFITQFSRPAIWAGAIAYTGLNLAFVALYGLENPASGVNRAPLFAFMALSLWLTYRVRRLQAKAGSVLRI